ncbi:PIG-L family deacetylase [Streptomyces actuosus]|uniref:PIG-L family deacetylase n=1 Tax=Streptomyces actuosus TaxID=1885 RepID=A0ABS2VYK4_STRAS|nr:PIG-L family deacetylase [Streptomyces actuosus]MBN0048228.1 PIG-L family deacetylase [Streptomyces actuosus]
MTPDAVADTVGQGAPVVVLSPHTDDAVLSCGALMAHARQQVPVTVLTLFTNGTPPPYTLSGRRCLRLAGMQDAEQLYAARRAEDREVLEAMGVTWQHAGFTDGLFRRKTAGSRRASRLLPERDHVYPTYRAHLAAGRISRHDDGLLRDVARIVRTLGAPSSPGGSGPLILAPLAVGGHADHLLVRTAAELSGRRVVYYADFPYDRRDVPDAAFVQRNSLGRPVAWTLGLQAKAASVLGYRTQAQAMFPGGQVPLVPEFYLFPGDSS